MRLSRLAAECTTETALKLKVFPIDYKYIPFRPEIYQQMHFSTFENQGQESKQKRRAKLYYVETFGTLYKFIIFHSNFRSWCHLRKLSFVRFFFHLVTKWIHSVSVERVRCWETLALAVNWKLLLILFFISPFRKWAKLFVSVSSRKGEQSKSKEKYIDEAKTWCHTVCILHWWRNFVVINNGENGKSKPRMKDVLRFG